MKQVRDSMRKHLLPVGMASVLTVGGLLSLVPAAGAQLDGNSYTTTNNVEVTWEDPWYADEKRTGYFEETPTDIVILFQDTGYQLAIAEYPSDYSLEELVEGEVDRAEKEDDAEVIDTVEEDESIQTSWIYEDPDGSTRGVYLNIYEFDTDYNLLVRVAAPVEDMEDAFDDLSTEVEIDGDEPFANVETADVVETFDAESGTSSNNGDDEETPEADGSEDDGAADDGSSDDGSEENGGDVDADEYLSTVQDNYDELSESVTSFNELLEAAGSGDLSDAEIQDLIDILDLWANAPDAAAELTVPDGMEDVQDLYEEYAGHLADAADAFNTLSEGGDSDQAAADLFDALDAAEATGADLEDALADAA